MLTVLDAAPYNADVSIEALLGGEPSAVAEALLGGRLQVVVNANVWEGGATSRDVVGDAPGGGPFSPLRAKWAVSSTGVAGGTPLVPAAAPGTAHLPGGVWARVSTWAPRRASSRSARSTPTWPSASGSSCPTRRPATRRADSLRAPRCARSSSRTSVGTV